MTQCIIKLFAASYCTFEQCLQITDKVDIGAKNVPGVAPLIGEGQAIAVDEVNRGGVEFFPEGFLIFTSFITKLHAYAGCSNKVPQRHGYTLGSWLLWLP